MRATQLLAGPALAVAALLCAVPLSHVRAQTPSGPTHGGGGVMAPSAAHNPTSRSRSGKAMTAPSGQSPRSRSVTCNQEANRRRLTGAARQGFRLDCLATAAPASHAGHGAVPPKPTHAKPALGAATSTHPEPPR
jgi:hypothetical protein